MIEINKHCDSNIFIDYPAYYAGQSIKDTATELRQLIRSRGNASRVIRTF